MGLFVLIIVGVVVAQTWFDWRKNSEDWVLPEWVKGVALGGVFAITIAALTSYATSWIQDPTTQLGAMLESHEFWPEVGLVGISVTILILMTRKRRLPWMLLLAGMILAAFWVGMVLGS
ncbi:MAG TPA: hypothetical protein VMB47_09205 [Candidatus Aquilonibacter sp.]|nr:hypothetical protein [Candidatus Aquilonibacter sp.]